MSRILIIEDDAAILRGLTDSLEAEGHEVLSARDGEVGYRLLSDQAPDLVILDIMLPKLGGFELCRRVRDEGGSMPILMLTARGDDADRVFGLDIGADDYVTKPFSVRELLARVRALLRRGTPPPPLPEKLEFDDVVVDFRGFEARKGDTVLKLTPKEFGALRLLAARAGQVVNYCMKCGNTATSPPLERWTATSLRSEPSSRTTPRSLGISSLCTAWVTSWCYKAS
jgi:DNA-binding response OmpR family regulator